MTPEVIEKEEKKVVSRRTLLKLGILFNGAVALAVIVPVIDYLLGPALKKSGHYNRWLSLGSIQQFPAGQTRLATFENPNAVPWDGVTGKTACYVRHVDGNQFQVFAVNCAHLGCPVRWFPQSQLFMCPCHGGVYYADGERAAGPPPRGLFTYKHKIINGQLHIYGGEMPTLATPA